MALTLTDLLEYDRARPAHLSDLIAIFAAGGTSDDYTADDLSAEKTTAQNAIKAACDTFDAGIPYVDGAAQLAALNTLKAAVDTAINSNISSTIVINISDVLTEAKTRLEAAIAADSVNFTYNDPRCQGTGRYARNQDDGSDDTTQIKCSSCDGFGRTATQNVTTSPAWTVTTTW